MKRVLKPELKAEHNREKINTNLYNANIKLQDENEMLKRDNEILQRRIDKAIEYINTNTLYSEDYDYDDEDNLVWNGAYDYKETEDLLNILTGEYYE